MSYPTNARSPIVIAILATTLICCALLILPGATASSKYFNDLLIFLDGGYRVVEGQVPNRDFHTALGPLTFYIPAFGFWITGNLGLAMPVGIATVVLVMAPIMIHVLRTRVRPLIAVPWAICLILLTVAPVNTGEAVINISFAMFYNRIGWALLGLLLMMHLQPLRPAKHQRAFDTSAAAALTLLLFYTKATYGLVALGFLLLLLLQPSQRRWAGTAIGVVVLSGGLIELLWGGTLMHVQDLQVAAHVSGVMPMRAYYMSLLDTSGEYIMVACLAGLALWQRGCIPDVLFYGFCACSGYALLLQNFQVQGIITLLAGGVVAAEILARQWRLGLEYGVDLATRGASLVVIVLTIPISISSAAALGMHAFLAATEAGVSLDTPNGEDIRVINILDNGQFEFYRDYARSLEDGVTLLSSLDPQPYRVLVMDFVSPLTSLAGLPPPEGGTAWMHLDRNFNEDFHFSPEALFRGVDVIMIPKKPIAHTTTEAMERIYGPHIRQHFRLVETTELWRVYLRRSIYSSVAEAGARDEALRDRRPM